MVLVIDLFLNLFTNPFFWGLVYFSFIGIYLVNIIYHKRNPEKHLPFFKSVDIGGSISSIIFVLLVPTTTQPRIYGTLGIFLTPSDQIMRTPIFNLGIIPGLILTVIGFIMTIIGVIILTITANKILKVIGLEQFESKKILDTGFWGIVRNPIYMSLVLMYLGMAFILGAVYTLIFVPIFYGTMWLFGWIEATVNLEETFGKEKVEEYKKKVPYMLFNKPLWIFMLGLSIYLIVLAVLGYVPLF